LMEEKAKLFYTKDDIFCKRLFVRYGLSVEWV
jgi:hypothetical protein